MTTQWLMLGGAVLLTAALSTTATLLAARWLFRRRYLPEIRRELDQILERLGQEVEHRVREGVVQGFRSLPSAETARLTREGVTEAASELVRGGLGALLGDRPAKKQP